jgi:hypothetical protein
MTSRLNILIGKSFDGTDHTGASIVGNTVTLRDGYTEHPSDTRILVAGKSVWQPDARNNAGNLGGFGVRSDIPGIERAVATIRAQWGDLPVQDNSGKCPHLASR